MKKLIPLAFGILLLTFAGCASERPTTSTSTTEESTTLTPATSSTTTQTIVR